MRICYLCPTPLGAPTLFDPSHGTVADVQRHLSLALGLDDLRILQDGLRLNRDTALTELDAFSPLEVAREVIGGAADDDDEEEQARDKDKISIKVMRQDADPLEFRIKRSGLFGKIYKAIANSLGVSEDSFVLTHDGKRIAKTATPKMLEFDDEEQIDFQQAQVGGAGSDEGEGEAEAEEPDRSKCHIKILFPDGEELEFALKKSTKFEKIFANVAKRRGIMTNAFRLIYEDTRINPNDTPKMLEMEDDANLVDFKLEQTGGSC